MPKINANQDRPNVVNTPLRKNEKEPARNLANLYEEFVVDPNKMSSLAAEYIGVRSWMTPEIMEKWRVGWIPGNGRSMFRKHYLTYTHRDIRDEVVSYSGRHLSFQEKKEAWIRKGKPEGSKPFKHKFVAGFHRGAELYGGWASRLDEPRVLESLKNYGLVVVEGMNDVIRLDEAGICSVGLCSNKATDQQVKQLRNFAQRIAGNRVLLLPDCDTEGEIGFKELLWKLNIEGLNVKLGVASAMFEGKFQGKQPEDFSKDELDFIVSS